MSRTTQYMFLKRPKQVYSRGKLECKSATPQLLQLAVGKTIRNQLFFLCL